MADDASRDEDEGPGRQGRRSRGGDVHQSDAYRTADPRDLVIEGDTAMMGPGGHPGADREPDVRDQDEDGAPEPPRRE